MGAQFCNRVVRRVDAREAHAGVRGERAILGVDERRDLLQQQNQRGGEPVEIVARQRASVRLGDRTIERRQCRVVRRVGVAPLALEPVEVVGRHAKLMDF